MVTNWQATFARVRSALMRRGCTSHEVDDMVQEAWVRLARYEREKAVLEPEAFLMRTALNLSVDTHRARVSHGEEVLLDETDLIDGAPSADAVLLGRERMARLSLCLGRLNDKRRNIFLAQRVEGMTYREIAHHYQMSISSVEKHIAKALLQVTSWMEGW